MTLAPEPSGVNTRHSKRGAFAGVRLIELAGVRGCRATRYRQPGQLVGYRLTLCEAGEFAHQTWIRQLGPHPDPATIYPDRAAGCGTPHTESFACSQRRRIPVQAPKSQFDDELEAVATRLEDARSRRSVRFLWGSASQERAGSM